MKRLLRLLLTMARSREAQTYRRLYHAERRERLRLQDRLLERQGYQRLYEQRESPKSEKTATSDVFDHDAWVRADEEAEIQELARQCVFNSALFERVMAESATDPNWQRVYAEAVKRGAKATESVVEYDS